MGCSKCKKKNKNNCICDSAIKVPTVYSNGTLTCPNPNPCSDITFMECVCYNGPTIVDLGINKGDSLDKILHIISLAITNPDCILPGNTCGSVTEIDFDYGTCGNNSFTVNWIPISSAISYIVQYKLSTSDTWLSQPTVTPPITTSTIGGLIPNTWYDVRINTICSMGQCYSLTLRIKTLL